MNLLEMDKAFVQTVGRDRCVCIPFNSDLNATYEKYIVQQEEMTSLVDLMLRPPVTEPHSNASG